MITIHDQLIMSLIIYDHGWVPIGRHNPNRTHKSCDRC